jgi:hypothetical protein
LVGKNVKVIVCIGKAMLWVMLTVLWVTQLFSHFSPIRSIFVPTLRWWSRSTPPQPRFRLSRCTTANCNPNCEPMSIVSPQCTHLFALRVLLRVSWIRFCCPLVGFAVRWFPPYFCRVPRWAALFLMWTALLQILFSWIPFTGSEFCRVRFSVPSLPQSTFALCLLLSILGWVRYFAVFPILLITVRITHFWFRIRSKAVPSSALLPPLPSVRAV